MKPNQPDHFNIWYKRIRLALKLEISQVVQIMGLGGITVTKSQVDGWKRPNADDRYKIMTRQEFDSFTFGLVEYHRPQEKKHND